MSKNKTVLVISVVILVVALAFLGYTLANKDDSSKTQEAQVSSTQEVRQENGDTKDTNRKWAEAKIKSAGLNITERDSQVSYQSIGAIDGAKYNLEDGTNVEIYEYTDSSKLKEGKEILSSYATVSFIEKDNILVIVDSSNQELLNKFKAALES